MSSDFKAKNDPPKWKKQEFFQFTTAADGTYEFEVNSVIPIDRIRISLGCSLLNAQASSPGLLIYSDIVNNYVGSLPKNYSDTFTTTAYYADSIEVGDGMDFVYPNKVVLQGTYQLKLYKYDGTVYSTADNLVFMLVEYFVDL